MQDTGFQRAGGQARPAGHRLHDGSREEGARALRRCAATAAGAEPPPSPPAARAGLDGRRLSRLRPDAAEQGPARQRAHPVAAVGRADDDRPAHARAEAAPSCSSATGASWGMGGAWSRGATDLCHHAGRYGWDGGFGTSAPSDPAEDMVGILMTQRMMDLPRAAERLPRLLDLGLPGDRRSEEGERR